MLNFLFKKKKDLPIYKERYLLLVKNDDISKIWLFYN